MNAQIPDKPELTETSESQNQAEIKPTHQIRHGHKFIFGYLFLLILAAAVGFGWHVYHDHHNVIKATVVEKSITKKKSINTNSTKASVTQYLNIPEWGVEMPLTSTIEDAYYVESTSTSKDPDGLPSEIWLGLSSLTSSSCNPANNNVGGSGAIGGIVRVPTTYRDPVTNELYPQEYPNGTTIVSYYYAFTTGANDPNNKCPQASMQTAVNSFSSAAKQITIRPNPYTYWDTFTDQQGGITFQYPPNWINQVTRPNSSFTTNPTSFAGLGGTITSPSGNTLTWIYQAIGGKGDAECTPNPGDVAFSSGDNCGSKQIISIQQIPSAKPSTNNISTDLFGGSLFITETKYSWSSKNGITADPVTNRSDNEPIYQICLDPYYNATSGLNGPIPANYPQVGTNMGFELPCNWWDTGFNVTFPVANQAGFRSSDAKTAILIMESFNSL